MTDNDYGRRDDGSTVKVAMAALCLVVAGLGLMYWDNHRPHDSGRPSTHSALAHR